MRKLISALLLLAACQQQPVSTGSAPKVTTEPTIGATSPDAAVQGYLRAVEKQDLQAISAMWGTSEGSVLVTKAIPREEMERRELIILCYLKHDSFRVLGDAPAPQGKRVVATELKRGGLTRSTNFYVVQGPASRWFVENVDLEPLRDLLSQDRCVSK